MLELFEPARRRLVAAALAALAATASPPPAFAAEDAARYETREIVVAAPAATLVSAEGEPVAVEAALAGDELIAAVRTPADHDRLHHALRLDGCRKLLEARFGKIPPGLIAALHDVRDGNRLQSLIRTPAFEIGRRLRRRQKCVEAAPQSLPAQAVSPVFGPSGASFTPALRRRRVYA